MTNFRSGPGDSTLKLVRIIVSVLQFRVEICKFLMLNNKQYKLNLNWSTLEQLALMDATVRCLVYIVIETVSLLPVVKVENWRWWNCTFKFVPPVCGCGP